MHLFPLKLPLPLDVFHELRDLIYAKSGLFYADEKRSLLESRLQPKLRERHCPSFREYLHVLKHEAWRNHELAALFAAVTTNETYFYRDTAQLQAFMDHIVPAIMQANQQAQRLRIWSAACSTGDEPYTLAMLLLELPALAKWSIDILATDLNEEVLATARRGLYGPYAIRHVPPRLLDKYFTADHGQYQIAPRVQTLVRFAKINLFEPFPSLLTTHLDVIFCRNCLIYFDDRAKQLVLNRFYDALSHHGYLVLGFSESLHALTRTFRSVPATKAVVYRKV